MLETFTLAQLPVLDSITPEAFASDIIPAAKPVVIKGLLAHWPAVRQGKTSAEAVAAYIGSMDNGNPTTVLEALGMTKGRFDYGPDMHDFNFHKRSKSISAGLEQLLKAQNHPNPPYIYIQSTPTPQHLPRFADENPNPLLPPSIAPRIWISNATRAQTHNDNDHNLACVVAGRRRFTLFPPEQVANLYIGPMEHTPSGRAISLASLEAPDFDKHPRFREALAHAQVAELEPGDALYMPRYWWHHVQSLESFNILINYWWGGVPKTDHPMVAFQAAVLAIKSLPESERAYWQAMFEHYIFEANGDPVAHIPLKHQGGLGKMTPALRSELIASLQQIFDPRR